MAMAKIGLGAGTSIAALAGIGASLNGYAHYVAVAAYLGVTGVAFWIAMQNADAFRDILREKAPEVAVSTLEPPASFSRLVGIIGAAMLVAFLWCYGLLILLAVVSPTDAKTYADRIATMEGSLQDFIYIGAALFAPYAANQLSRILGPRTLTPVDQDGTPVTLDKTAVEMIERGKVRAALNAYPDPVL